MKHFEMKDYDALVSFLIRLNQENRYHMNWNWARLEWMIGHPQTDLSLINSIGLWFDNKEIVACAIYDMYFGEASILALKDYEYLYPEILDYAYNNLKDDQGLGIAIYDKDEKLINYALQKGFKKREANENIMVFELESLMEVTLPKDISISEVDCYSEMDKMGWLFWQGFNHGNDYNEYLSSKDDNKTIKRPNFNKHFSLAAKNMDGEYVSYASLWYKDGLDYAYLEPVCCIPDYRKNGITKAILYENFNRAKALGVKHIYVESDMEFYKRIGFKELYHYDFYWKK